MRAFCRLVVIGCVLLAGLPAAVPGQSGGTGRAAGPDAVYVIIRNDDVSAGIHLTLNSEADSLVALIERLELAS